MKCSSVLETDLTLHSAWHSAPFCSPVRHLIGSPVKVRWEDRHSRVCAVNVPAVSLAKTSNRWNSWLYAPIHRKGIRHQEATVCATLDKLMSYQKRKGKDLCIGAEPFSSWSRRSHRWTHHGRTMMSQRAVKMEGGKTSGSWMARETRPVLYGLLCGANSGDQVPNERNLLREHS